MAWYATSTVSVTNGSATVTGSGTGFNSNVSIGEAFIGPDGRVYEITNVVSDTVLSIKPNYLGSTASGQSYAILPARGRIADLIAETSSLLTSFSNVRDGIGSGLFPDGSATTPAGRFTNDQDTGFYRSGTNGFGIATAGVGRFVIDGAGVVTVNPATTALALNILGASRFGPNSTAWLTDAFTAGSDFTTWVIGSTYFNGTNYVTPNLGSNHVNAITARSAGLFFHCAVSTGASERVESPATFATYIRMIVAGDGGVTPGADNTQILGRSNLRWSLVYAGTGTINTSDEREKHWRGALNADELRAAKRIIAELGIYQWNDAVAEKGEDGARLHFGVRAQRAFAILEEEGMEWQRYAWCCHDAWDEQTEPVLRERKVMATRTVYVETDVLDPETGEPLLRQVEENFEETHMEDTGETRVTGPAGDRYGIRPDQLAFWLIAAQAAVQADLEARLAALEAA